MCVNMDKRYCVVICVYLCLYWSTVLTLSTSTLLPTTPSTSIVSTTEPTTPNTSIVSKTEPTTPTTSIVSTTEPTTPNTAFASTIELTTLNTLISSITEPTTPNTPIGSTTEPTTPNIPIASTTESTTTSTSNASTIELTTAKVPIASTSDLEQTTKKTTVGPSTELTTPKSSSSPTTQHITIINSSAPTKELANTKKSRAPTTGKLTTITSSAPTTEQEKSTTKTAIASTTKLTTADPLNTLYLVASSPKQEQTTTKTSNAPTTEQASTKTSIEPTIEQEQTTTKAENASTTEQTTHKTTERTTTKTSNAQITEPTSTKIPISPTTEKTTTKTSTATTTEPTTTKTSRAPIAEHTANTTQTSSTSETTTLEQAKNTNSTETTAVIISEPNSTKAITETTSESSTTDSSITSTLEQTSIETTIGSTHESSFTETTIATSPESKYTSEITMTTASHLLAPETSISSISDSTTSEPTTEITSSTTFTVFDNNTTTMTMALTPSPSPPLTTTRLHIDCGSITAPSNGSLSYSSGTTYKSVANFTCHTGYTLTGNITSTCEVNSTWSANPPTCVIKDCGSITAPSNGSLSYSSGTTYKSVATFTCHTGYTLTGNITSTCEVNSTWSANPPTCVIKDCGSITAPSNGSLSYSSGTTYKSVATFTCHTGYTLTGNITSTCEVNSTWSANPPTCVIKDCGSITAPSNGSLFYSSGTTYKSVATFTCHTGYTLTGNITSTCEVNSTWSANPPTCVIKDCGSITAPSNGSLFYSSGTTYKSVATFTCHTGYTLTGNITSTCEVNSTWSANPPTCVIKDCGSITAPSNGSLSYSSGTTYKSVATFTCHTGYTLTGNITSTCEVNSTWSANPPTCVIKDCGSITAPSNGSLFYSSGTTYKSVATFTCHTGYTLTGNITSTCEVNSTWSANPPTCVIKDCGSITAPSNGSLSYSSGTTYKSVATFTCHTGYTLTGNITSTCEVNSTWSANLPTCVIKDCGSITAPSNGSLFYSSGTTYKSVATFTCHTGYTLTGNITSTCEVNSTWSANPPTCVIKDCGSITAPSNGSLSYSSGTTYKSVATFTCHTGYTLTGNITSTCEVNSTWSANPPTCVIKDCGSITAPSNGSLSYSSGTTYKSVATFTCHTGYTLTGNITSTCEVNSTWSANPPTCVIKDCGSITAPSNGSLSYSSGTTYKSVATFTCHTGYTLTGNITSTCEVNSTWSANPPTCVIKDCGTLTYPLNGDVIHRNGTTFGSIAEFVCNTGYNLVPPIESATCEASGNWSSTVPSCQIKDCGNLTDPLHGNVNQANGTFFESIAVFSCNPGYDLDPLIASATCGASGMWSANVPNCKAKDCGKLTDSENGNVNQTNGTFFQSIASFRCNTGYDLDPPILTATCEASGNWSDAVPSCQIKDCGNLTGPLNGNVNQSNGTTFESIAIFSCDSGYDLDPTITSVTCEANGNWSAVIPSCRIKDCGRLPDPFNGIVNQSNGTTFGSISTLNCIPGYDLEPSNISSITCEASGNWSAAMPTCQIKDCEMPDSILNGDLKIPSGTAFGALVFYHCETGYKIVGNSRQTCGQDGKWTGKPECIEDKSQKKCPKDIDHRGYEWTEISAGEVASELCNKTKNSTGLSGLVERKCGSDGIWKLPQYNCIRQELKKLENEINDLKKNPTSGNVESALKTLSSVTNETDKKGALYEGELKSATNMLENIADITKNHNITISKNQSEAFINTASNLLDTTNQNSWQAISESSEQSSGSGSETQDGATKVLQIIDTYASALAKSGGNRTVEQKNVVLHVASVDKETGIRFPSAPLKSFSTNSSISLGTQNLDGSSYSAVLYKNLTGILPSNTDKSNEGEHYAINSAVLSLDLHKTSSQSTKLDVTITLEHFQHELTNPLCSFWNMERNLWDSDGCSLQSSNSTISICKCTHLTNFAILMSPWTEDNVVSTAIDIISTVGCGISLLGLLITVVFHIALWRYLKSDRNVILMNFCVALVLSYAIFLAGIDRTENRGVCTAVAVLLQYIYLVVFFLMLAEGIELAVTIIYVFTTSSRIRWMLPLAWGLPAVIVGISVGATETEGYGTKDFCWLSVEDGLIWGFVGPALLIILINMILLILVMRAMFKATTLAQKSLADKVKTGVRSLCVLLPLMGCTWALGIFYVNKDFAWVQYVFAVCNSLQGLVIFIFHCAMNTQIHSGVQRKMKRYYDSRSVSSNATKRLNLPRLTSSSGSQGRISISSIGSYGNRADKQNGFFSLPRVTTPSVDHCRDSSGSIDSYSVQNGYFEMRNTSHMRGDSFYF